MKIALIFLILGIISGAIYGLSRFIATMLNKNIIVQIILDFLSSICIGAIFILSNIHYFYGEIRAYICALFALGIYLERKTLGKLFAKLYLMLYNWTIIRAKNLKKSKLGKIIFK